MPGATAGSPKSQPADSSTNGILEMLAGRLRSFAARAAGMRAFRPVIRTLESRDRRNIRLRVLAYHRIDTNALDSTCYPGLISASPDHFARQMQFLAENYRVISLADLQNATDGTSTLPASAVLLTFDDATVDFAVHAWPVLKSLGLPATVFVPTLFPDHPGSGFWWDRLYRAIVRSPAGTTMPTPDGMAVLNGDTERQTVFRLWRDRLKSISHQDFLLRIEELAAAGGVADPSANNVLGWDALRRLDLEGVTLAPHTHSHPMLNRCSRDCVLEELQKSIRMLEEQLGHPVPRALAYPAGGVSDHVVSAMQEAGFRLGFTTERGVNTWPFPNPLLLKRTNVGARTNLALLRLQLSNWGK